MNYQEVENEWEKFESQTVEEIVDLSMESHILTLREYMDVQIGPKSATAVLRDIDVFTEKEKMVRLILPIWAANALREATFCLNIKGKLYIPTPYVIQRNFRDVFGLSGIAVSANIDRMARDKFLAALFKEKGIVKIVSKKERQGVRLLEMIKTKSQKELHAVQLAGLFASKYKTVFEIDRQNPDLFCYTVFFPEMEKDGFVYGVRAEDSVIGRSGIIFYILVKDIDSNAVFYLDSRSRGHRSNETAESFFEDIESALLKAAKKKLSLDISADEVLNRAYPALKAKKREQFRNVLSNNIAGNPLLSAYHALDILFPKKDYSDSFYDAGKSKFLLSLGGALTEVNPVC